MDIKIVEGKIEFNANNWRVTANGAFETSTDIHVSGFTTNGVEKGPPQTLSANKGTPAHAEIISVLSSAGAEWMEFSSTEARKVKNFARDGSLH